MEEKDIKFYDCIDNLFRSMFESVRYRVVNGELIHTVMSLMSHGFDEMNKSGEWGYIKYDMNYEIDGGVIYNIFIRLVDNMNGYDRESGFVISFSHNLCDIKRVR